MLIHLVRIGALIILIGLGMAYPYLPGSYDRLALALSNMAQVFGSAGLLLVPIGVLWLIYQRLTHKPGTYFALVALIAATLVALVIAIVGFASAGPALGLLTLALWVYIVSKLRPRKSAEGFNPAPLYCISLPLVAVGLQLGLADSLTEASRNRAMMNSAQLIADIEEYHIANDRYPESLVAVWKDYPPGVVGIEQYHYALAGDAYNLVFEQQLFLFDNLGAREFVVYNPLDAQTMMSHDSWIFFFSPEALLDNQGWYEVHEVGSPHWKVFWFD
jgi:hypothetical protein